MQHFDYNLDIAVFSNFALLLQATGRDAEAAPIYERLLARERPKLPEEANDRTAIFTGQHHHNFIALSKRANRLREAEPALRTAVAQTLGGVYANSPRAAEFLDDLATLLWDSGRSAEAEPIVRRQLSILEKLYGPEHREVGAAMNKLAMIRADLGDWAEAATLHQRAKPIMIAARSREVGIDRSGVVGAVVARNTWNLRAAARGPRSVSCRR